MSLRVCGRIASAVGLKLDCRSDNCSAFTKTDPPTFFKNRSLVLLLAQSGRNTSIWHLSKAVLPHVGVTKKLNAGGIDYEKKKNRFNFLRQVTFVVILVKF